MTRLEQRLEKAKKLFPSGTKFTSLFGADDIVADKKTIKSYFIKEGIYFIDKYGTIIVFCKSGQFRVIFDNNTWAKKY